MISERVDGRALRVKKDLIVRGHGRTAATAQQNKVQEKAMIAL